tara:strand:- start:285 stop:524 length:240 start_codon:yes stop_codon:yes gene_type:complete
MSDLEQTITNMIQGEVDSAIYDAICNSQEIGDMTNNHEYLQSEFDTLKEEFEAVQQSHEELMARFDNLLDMNPTLKEED